MVENQLAQLQDRQMTSDFYKSGNEWKTKVATLEAQRNRITVEIGHLSIEIQALTERSDAAGQLFASCNKFIAGGAVA
jgi:hypothetical protein